MGHLCLSIRGKTYRGSSFRLEKADLELPSHGVVALFGPNGAGKSTTMTLIAERPDVTFLPQAVSLPRHVKLTDFLRYAAYTYGLKPPHAARVTEALAATDMQEYAQQRLGGLSGGQQRRALIAQTLMADRPIVLLDEPTVGLDVDQRENFQAVLRAISSDHLVMISTHIVEDIAGLADHIVILTDGVVRFDGSATAFYGDQPHSAQAFISRYRELS